MKQQRIHFIGICGVAMSAIALAFKRQGWKVTGSDVGFYPPISTYLKDAGVDFYPGWHPDRALHNFSNGGKNDEIVVVGNVAGSTNPEWLYAQEHKLNYKSYPEVIKEYLVKQNSIVCAGTYGKTTSTALMTWILKEAGWNPSYMFGGLMIAAGGGTPPLPSAEMTDANWSILEGDEYKTSRWDNGAKFFHYSPTHLLLTSAVWDHADVYPTEEAYIEAFKKLAVTMPEGGLKVVSEKIQNVILNEAKSDKVISYGKSTANNYIYSNVTQSKDGIAFDITHEQKKYSITSLCLGEYMADNATGCFALARQIGIKPEKIISAIASFPGLKRRLEKRQERVITVFDDIAHSPTKARAVLESLRKIYTDKIYAVFEPNAGNRRPEAAPGYDNAFLSADAVIIPRLTKIKFDPNDLEPPFEGDELARIIGATHPDTRYLDDDAELVNWLEEKTQPGDVVVFMGSHGFRGMIERLTG